jgi:transcriptional regulator with XRE-family HTH domain
MSRIETKRNFNHAAIEAEENFLIDLQFLLQEVMTDGGVTRADLAKKLGLSKARLSQIFASEANPTVKSCARLFHALGKELSVCVKARAEQNDPTVNDVSDWRVETKDAAPSGRKRHTADDDRLVACLIEAFVSNDNYRNQVEILGSGEPVELQAA